VMTDDIFGEVYAPPVAEYPAWYRPSKERPKANIHVLNGRHPLGSQLGAEASTCGTCAALYSRAKGSTYYKCTAHKISYSPATDVRLKWRGCELWEKAKGE